MDPHLFCIELDRLRSGAVCNSHYRRFVQYAMKKIDAGLWGPDGPLAESNADLLAHVHPVDELSTEGGPEQYAKQVKTLENIRRRPANCEVKLAYWDARLRSLAAARQKEVESPGPKPIGCGSMQEIYDVLDRSGEFPPGFRSTMPWLTEFSESTARHDLPESLTPASLLGRVNPGTDLPQPGGTRLSHHPPAELQLDPHLSPAAMGAAPFSPGIRNSPAVLPPVPCVRAVPDTPPAPSTAVAAVSAARPRPVAPPKAAQPAPPRAHLQAQPGMPPRRGVCKAAVPRKRLGMAQLLAARPELGPPPQPVPAAQAALPLRPSLPATPPPPAKRSLHLPDLAQEEEADPPAPPVSLSGHPAPLAGNDSKPEGSPHKKKLKFTPIAAEEAVAGSAGTRTRTIQGGTISDGEEDVGRHAGPHVLGVRRLCCCFYYASP